MEGGRSDDQNHLKLLLRFPAETMRTFHELPDKRQKPPEYIKLSHEAQEGKLEATPLTFEP